MPQSEKSKNLTPLECAIIERAVLAFMAEYPGDQMPTGKDLQLFCDQHHLTRPLAGKAIAALAGLPLSPS